VADLVLVRCSMRTLVFFFMGFAFIGFAIHWRFLQQLRDRHPATWQSLGQPSLLWNNSMGTRLEIWRFLLRKDYQDLADPQFSRLANLLRVYKIAFAIVFAAIFVGGFFWSYLGFPRHI